MESKINSAEFDPYHTWLGIPPEHRPADFYRLLGLERFESDAEVIDIAANRQCVFLKQVANDATRSAALQLIAEVTEARRVLIDPRLRRQYDIELKANASPSATSKQERKAVFAPSINPSDSMGSARANPFASFETTKQSTSGKRASKPEPKGKPLGTPKKGKRNRQLAIVILGAGAAILLLLTSLVVLQQRQPAVIDSTTPTQSTSAIRTPSEKTNTSPNAPAQRKATKPSAAVANLERFTGSMQPRSVFETGLPEAMALPVQIDFQDASWKDGLTPDDQTEFGTCYEVSDGQLRVKHGPSEGFDGLSLHVVNAHVTPVLSFALDVRMPRGLGQQSGITLQAGKFRLSLRVASTDALTVQTDCGDPAQATRTQVEYESVSDGQQRPYTLFVQQVPSPAASGPSATWRWKLLSPANRTYGGEHSNCMLDEPVKLLIKASRTDKRRSYFWIDNLRYPNESSTP
ncbi:MAG: hypothetical protein R3C05_10215 [Pirellulaceae bacterium]